MKKYLGLLAAFAIIFSSDLKLSASESYEDVKISSFMEYMKEPREGNEYISAYNEFLELQIQYDEGIITSQELNELTESSLEKYDYDAMVTDYTKVNKARESNVTFLGVTPQEIIVCSTNATKCNTAIKLKDIAVNKTYVNWNSNTHYQGNGDAFRHAYWSGLMTKHISKSFAEKLGLAHEGLTNINNWSNFSNDTKMDVKNNTKGRDIGYTYRNRADSYIAHVIQNSIKNGKLTRLDSNGYQKVTNTYGALV